MKVQSFLIRSILFGSIALSLPGQVDRATLSGTVTDPSGAVITDASVEADSITTGKAREAVTNSAGIYGLPKLAPGTYNITFKKQGFQTVRFESVDIQVGKNVTLDARMNLAPVSTAVDVQAAAPLLERSSADYAGVVDREQIENLPTNGRNWSTLLILTPLAIDDGGGDQRSIRFAGRARDDNNYRMDGIDATGIQEQAQKSTTRLQIPADAVQEYRVGSGLYTAEYGAGSGGQVDVVTKSGSNVFHGSAFDYLRNSVFDSRSFLDLDLDPAATGPTKVPAFRMNQFGGTLGGPLVQNKTFFFASFEAIRQFRGETLHALVPSAGFKAQVLAQSPALASILQFYPDGQLAVDPQTAEYTHQGSVQVNETSGLFRLDHRFTDKTFLFARVVIDDSQASAPLGNLQDTQKIVNRPQNYVVSLQHVFSPAIFNEFKAGVNRSPFHNPQSSVTNLAVGLASYEGLNNDNTDHEVGTTYSYIDDLSMALGRHTLKFGGELRYIDLNQGITEDNAISFADNNGILNNRLDSFSLKGSWWGRGLRHHFILPYVQDEWKVRPNLTVNLGLRWEYYSPVYEVKNRARVFDLERCHGICAPGSPLEFPNYRNFDPRAAIAWAPTEHTVIRTGFGIYHGPAQNDDRNAALESDNVRLSLSSSDVSNLSYPIDPFIPLALSSGIAPRALQRDRKDLYAMEYGFSIQHDLFARFQLQTGYFGSQGRRLFARTYINTIDPLTGQRPLPNFGMIDLKRNDANSSFNAWQTSLNRRFASGWMFGLQYMWSHSQNDGSVGGGESNAPQNVACRHCDWGPSVFDVRHNIVANFLYELPFGAGKSFAKRGFAAAVLGGWELSGMNVWHTGHPLDVTMNIDSSYVPGGNNRNVRPDVVPGVSVVPAGQNVNNWVNPAAFTVPPTDANGNLLRFGNAGRGLVRAPITWQTDLALMKRIRLSERLRMQVIAQAFNVFNHDQYADPSNLALAYNPPDANHPNGYITAPGGFGQITSSVNFNSNSDKFAADNTGSGLPRQFQFALRFEF